MRIIAGTFRSRPLQAPPGLATRPTTDRLRETLFNVLAPRIKGAAFLDLYAGSGAVGLEAISRGAAHVTFLERAPAALKVLRANLSSLALFNLVFLDPPYDAGEEYTTALNLLGAASQQALAPDAIVIAEHRRKQTLNPSYGNLHRYRLLEQGDAALSFYQAAQPPAPAPETTSEN